MHGKRVQQIYLRQGGNPKEFKWKYPLNIHVGVVV